MRFLKTIFISTVFCSILFYGCNNPKLSNQKIINSEDFKNIVNLQTLKTDTFGLNLLHPSDILLIGDTLVVRDVKTNEYALHLFKIPEMTYICSQGLMGEGPGENIGAWQLHEYIKNEYSVLDVTLNKVFIFNKDSVKSPAPVKTINLPDTIRPIMDHIFLNDSILLLVGIRSLKKYYKFDFRNNTIKGLGEFPEEILKDHTPQNLKADACESYLISNPNKSKYAIFMRNASRFDIYNETDKNESTVYCPGKIKPEYNIDADNRCVMSKNAINSYVYLYADTSKICALYSGIGYREENSPYSKTMFVFDWRGNPLFLYKLENEILAFAIDNQRKKIYGIRPGLDYPLIIFNLPN